ncbi:hypothetical protein DC20_19500 [Rufibacter tibetensis]|uniref:Uncharacterized protein n=2 Tax=Rufibacter tibetensis TaxID=512763 RepID=A0A0P0CFT4_9BACT|nr:hypothetical protein DC20_19500 [Rufibacter tibetensis]
MVKNQNLLKLVKNEVIEPGEYISTTSFVEETSFYGQYLANLIFVGFDKDSFYFIDVDGYLIKSDYVVTTINSESTIVLTSTSVHSSEDAADALQLNLATNINSLIRRNISTKQLAVV